MQQNTALARKLALEYERITGRCFPGGIENAYVLRTYAGRNQVAAGAWSRFLMPIYNTDEHGNRFPMVNFGSIATAKEADADPSWLEEG